MDEQEKTFTRELLLSLSNWQRGWRENQTRRREIADELVRNCANLPEKYRTVDSFCYRKRFINAGELIPIIIDNDFFEGIASWTNNLDYAKGFKGIVRMDSKFVMVFKHKPLPEEIVVNIVALWEDEDFIKAAEEFKDQEPKNAEALFHFKDEQSEIILRSTLVGSEIEDIVGVSSSFEDLCDMAEIPENQREKLSIKFARDPEGLPIEIPTFAGSRATAEAIRKTVIKFGELITTARDNSIPVDWSKVIKPHEDDLKHRIIKGS